MKLKAFLIIFSLVVILSDQAVSQQTQSLSFPIPKVDVQIGTSQDAKDVSVSLQILL